MTLLTERLVPRLMREEGFRATPSRDTRGILTVGYGTNLDDGLSADEAMFLLEYRINRAVTECAIAFRWFRGLDPVRQEVLVSLAYQLGIQGLRTFRRMLGALEQRDFVAAAAELEDSALAREDAPARTARAAAALRVGTWP